MTLHPQWCHCRADRTVVRTVRAADFATACRVIGPVPEDHYVISAASHAVGYARPLAPSKCRSCGVRESRAGYDRCDTCRAGETVKAQRRTGAKSNRNYARGVALNPRSTRLVTGRTRQKTREANIRRGLAQRAAKRQGGTHG